MIRFRLCISGRKNKKVMLFFFCLHFFLIGFILLEQFRFTAKCFFVYKLVLSEVAQSCLTLCDPMDYSLPGSSVHGIFQARILEWVVISFSRESSQHRDWTWVSCIAGRYMRFKTVNYHFDRNDRKFFKNLKSVSLQTIFCVYTMKRLKSVAFYICLFIYWKNDTSEN